MKKSSAVYAQAGTIAFRIKNNKIEFLIITTRKNNYTIPKGIIEEHQTPQQAALQELLEEAGAEGFVFHEIGTYEYKKWHSTCHVQVFLMLLEKLHESWQEDSFRDRIFVNFKQLDKYIKKTELLKLFKKSHKTIKRIYGL